MTRAEQREARMTELRRAIAAELAGIAVTRHDQLCSGGREPIPFGARAYEDVDGWVYCPAHIPEPDQPNQDETWPPVAGSGDADYDEAAQQELELTS